jgi:carbamoyltransferase
MYILGLNGCHKRSHDASACLIKDNKLIAMIEEERFIRKKRAFDCLPINAVNFCLDQAKISLDDIDLTVMGFDAGKKINLSLDEFFPANAFKKITKKISIKKIQHHLAHASSVYFTSGFKDAAIIVVDGQGETEATSIFSGKGNNIKLIKNYDYNYSLGFLYSAVSVFCGLGVFGAGKLMGLAAYGQPKYHKVLKEIFGQVELPKGKSEDYQDEFCQYIELALKKRGFNPAKRLMRFNSFTGKQEKIPEILKQHKDLAASVQEFLEEKLIELTLEAKKLTGLTRLCLAGGVALNCVANSKIEEQGIFKEIFIQPGCEDSGVALGAALAITKKPIEGLLSPYLGPSYGQKNISDILIASKIIFKKISNIESATAKLIADGNIVGWFQGRIEYGPRALGNRSILADPRKLENKILVNNAKGRETWRPFAPSILEDRAADLLEKYVESPFMLKSFRVKKDWQKKIAAVVHVDGTTRPQTVNRQQNSRYFKLIKEFNRLTGVPAVLNTSFNYADEPI